MSREADNRSFATLVQLHLEKTGHYRGAIDGWAGTKTHDAFHAFVAKQEVQPEIDLPVPEPVVEPPGWNIILPHERDLNRFYGSSNSRGSYLEWFSFPVGNMRLYSRSGQSLSDRNGDGKDDHRCHKKVREGLEDALQEIFDTLGKDQFEEEGWNVYSGCFNYRRKRGGSTLSTHSWGIAIDINGGENAFRSSRTTFSDTAIDIMEKHGFLSGGRAWGHDYMHFQAAIPRISSGSYYDRHGLPKHIKAA